MGGADGLAGRFEQSYDVIEGVVAEALDGEYPLSWEGNTLAVELDEEQYAREFGGPGVPIQPHVRPRLIQAIDPARRAAEKVWNG